MAPSPLNYWARSSCHRSAAPRGRGKPATSAEILGWYNWGSIRKTLMKFDDWWYFKRRVFVAIPTMLGNGSISCCMLGDHIAYQGREVTCVGGPVNESKNIWELAMYFSGDDWSYESGRLLVLLHGNIVIKEYWSFYPEKKEWRVPPSPGCSVDDWWFDQVIKM